MKIKCFACCALCGFALIGTSLHGQGTFQNLDFESATLPILPPGQLGGLVPVSTALPYWSVFIGTNQVTQVLHNNYLGGDANVSILGPGWTVTLPLDGYYLLLQSGVVFTPGGESMYQADVSISQTGLIPVSTQSVRFKSIASHHFMISIGLQPVQVVQLSAAPDFSTVYGADVSQYAGSTQTLRITKLLNPFDDRYSLVDSIEFSPEPIPEPSALGLLGLGGFFLVRRLRRKA